MIGELDILDTVVEAKKLKQEFEELLVAILDAVRGVDLDNLKLRISWFLMPRDLLLQMCKQS